MSRLQEGLLHLCTDPQHGVAEGRGKKPARPDVPRRLSFLYSVPVAVCERYAFGQHKFQKSSTDIISHALVPGIGVPTEAFP